jgi:hypothetical protein
MTDHYLHSAQPDEVQPLKIDNSYVASEGRSVSQVSHGVDPVEFMTRFLQNWLKMISVTAAQRRRWSGKVGTQKVGAQKARGGGWVRTARSHHVDQSTLYYIHVYSLSSDLTTNPLCFH